MGLPPVGDFSKYKIQDTRYIHRTGQSQVQPQSIVPSPSGDDSDSQNHSHSDTSSRQDTGEQRIGDGADRCRQTG